MGAQREKKDTTAVAPKQKDVSNTQGTKPTKGTLVDYFRLFKFAKRLDIVLLSICFVASIGAGVAFPIMFAILARIINGFANYNAGIDQDSLYEKNSQNVLYIVYIFLAKLVLSYISIFAVRTTGLRLSAAIRLAYLQALFKQPLSSVDKLSPGKVSYRITASANTILLGVSQQLALFVQSVAFILGFFIISFVYNPLITIVACAVLPVTLICMGVSLPLLIKIGKSQEEYKEEASALSNEIFTSIRVVAAFGAEALLAKRHALWIDKLIASLIRSSPYVGLYLAPTLFITYGTSALTFYFGIQQYVAGRVDGGVGTLVLVYLAVMTATTSFSRLAPPGLAISQAASAAAEMFATIHAEVPETGGIKEPDASASADIIFEDIHFAYPSRPDTQILNGLHVRFEAGKTTAIVGPSGSGKSTIVGLVERWYDLNNVTKYSNEEKSLFADTFGPPGSEKSEKDSPSESPSDKPSDEPSDEPSDDRSGNELNVIAIKEATASGSIKVGPHNLQDVDLQWWRAQIGFVEQEPFLFNDTIFKNVVFGLCGTKWFEVDETTQRSMVEEACRQSYAHEFISAMPEGYDTVVGGSGLNLSGGQRQRIAIARSIVKNPPILILDEATSALDVHSEKIVQRALEVVSKNRTTIVIAHRLSTIKKADKIVVLRGGKMIEEGTHDSLVATKDGFYHSLVRAQQLMLGDDNRVDDVGITSANEKSSSAEILPGAKTQGDLSKVLKRLEGQESAYKQRGFIGSFGFLIWEQRHRVPLYAVVLISACICGGEFILSPKFRVIILEANVVMIATYPLMAWIFAQVINVFALPRPELMHQGYLWSLMFFVLAIVSLIAFFSLTTGAVQLSGIISGHYRKEYLTNLVNKPIRFFDEDGNSPGTLTSMVATDPQSMQQLMGAEMAIILISITNILGSIIISFVFGWKLALVGCLAVIPVILISGACRYKLEIDSEKMSAKVFKYSAQFATEAAGAFRTVTALTMEDTICNKYRVLLDQHVNANTKKSTWGAVIFALSDSIDLACNALVFWYGTKLIAEGEFDVISFFVVYQASIQSAQAAAAWFAFAPNMANAASASNRILSTREIRTAEPLSQSTLPSTSAGIGIQFKDVWFTYPTRSEAGPVLSGLNLEINPGQFAALVGPSGCGKSTIVSLIERFYTLDSGSVLCDDFDIAELDMASYRSHLALVAQEPTLYEGTIRDNITLSVGEQEVDEEEVHDACREAYIHDFIISLPDGYNTRLGPKGVSLSGGQKQRISVARALLRKPRLLLLDEATSSLDSESEKEVQAAIERAAGEGKRTILAVAHRLATIQKADVIFVLGPGGKIVEKGNHAELVREKGVYFQMCQAQALDK
ncbi:MAG: hypothetical protein M1820_008727 [Bogoriella megaspora]|nr:MAG: hypothetical protein M1820_008727 [Bogoriella megaspora]